MKGTPMNRVTPDAFSSIPLPHAQMAPPFYADVIPSFGGERVGIFKSTFDEHTAPFDYWQLSFYGTVTGANDHEYLVFKTMYAENYNSRKKPQAKMWYLVGNNLMGYHTNGEYAGITLTITNEVHQQLKEIAERYG